MNLPIKPGRLIRFRCLSGNIAINYWDAIYHGDNVVHTVGSRRKGRTWLLSASLPEDKISIIRHGVLVERDWDAYESRRLSMIAFDPCI